MNQEDQDSASLSVTLGIMRDIVTEVARRGVKVSDHLVGCLLKSVYQNPENGFSGDRALDRDDVRRLVSKTRLNYYYVTARLDLLL